MHITHSITALSLLSLASAVALPNAELSERQASSSIDAAFKARGKK
jgi:hypothetical protein